MAASYPNPPDGRGRPDDMPASNADPVMAALHAITERLDILAHELRTVLDMVHHNLVPGHPPPTPYHFLCHKAPAHRQDHPRL